MKLMMFESAEAGPRAPRLGLVEGASLVDLGRADATLPKDLESLIAAGPAALAAVSSAPAKAGIRQARARRRHTRAADRCATEVHRWPQLCAACQGGRTSNPDLSLLFPARGDVARGSKGAGHSSEGLGAADYECELAVVIGKNGRHIAEARALEHVFGYTLFNDVSVRDFQRKTTQWMPGKNFDATGPIGPFVVTANALPPGASGLKIMTRVNGETMQSSNTSDLIFSVAKTIALLSQFMTLEAGDIIATGTPSGVAHARKPPPWLKAGDVVEVEVESIGVLSNPIVDEA